VTRARREESRCGAEIGKLDAVATGFSAVVRRAAHALEQELATEAAAQEKAADALRPISNLEAARRIAFVLRLAYQEKGAPLPGNLMDQIVGLIGRDPTKAGS